MGIAFECGSCGKAFDVSPEVAGKTGRCKRCGALMTIPSASTATPVPTRRPAPEPASAEVVAEAPARARSAATVLPPRSASLAFAPRTALAEPKKKKKKKRWTWLSGKNKAKARESSGWGGGFSIGQIGVSLGGIILAVRILLIVLRVTHVFPAGDAGPGAGANRPAAPQRSARAVQKLAGKFDGKPIPLPAFPNPGPGREVEPGVTLHEVDLGPLNRPLGSAPGQGGRLWLYLPTPGGRPPADRSLPCVLITAAGTPLIHGTELGDGDRAEHLPYARAGFAVLAFELDGVPEEDEEGEDDLPRDAMVRFLAARAGLANAHVALEYALAKVPAVDPARVSIAGHSSAGTVAVLFAATEPRLRSAVAFAPAVDHEKRFGPALVAMLQQAGFGDLAVRYSPRRYVDQFRCPLFLFHARDDSNVPVADAMEFAAQVAGAGEKVTLDLVDKGDHYQSMIDQGIPRAIAWLKGEPAAGPRVAAAR